MGNVNSAGRKPPTAATNAAELCRQETPASRNAVPANSMAASSAALSGLASKAPKLPAPANSLPPRAGLSLSAPGPMVAQLATAEHEIVLLADHPDLPAVLLESEKNLRKAKSDLHAAKGHPEAEQAAAQKYQTAQGAYLFEFSAHIRHLSEAPQQAITPSRRQMVANMAGALASNLVGFTAPTAIAALVPEKMKNAAYASAVSVGSMIANELGPFVTRKFDGTLAQLRLSKENSANVGVYKGIAGDFALTMANLVIYGLANVALSKAPWLGDSQWGPAVKAGVSGAVMSVVGQMAITKLAESTLERNGVTQAKYLPEAAHNRSISDGVYLRNMPAWRDRTTPTNKLIEGTAAAFGSMLGASVMYGLMEGVSSRTSNPVQKAAADIFLAITAFFMVSSASKAVFTNLANDPAKHANKFGIAASTVLSNQLRAAAFNQFENLLDETGTDIANGHWGQQARAKFANTAEVLSGAVHRAKGPMDAANDLSEMFKDLAAGLASSEAREDLPTEGTINKIKKTLMNVSISLNIASASAQAGLPIQPELKDVNNRIRDLQALLLQSQFQLGGPEGLRLDTRVVALANDLLPTFAALRKVDRMDLAQSFTNSVMEYSAGRMSPQAAVAALGAKAHGRVLVADIAQHMKLTGQDPNVLLDELVSMFATAFDGKPPSVVSSKLLILSNMLKASLTEDRPSTAGIARDLLAGFAEIDGTTSQARAKTIVGAFVDAFKTGEFTLDELVGELDALSSRTARADDIEAGHSGDKDAHVIEQFKQLLGEDFAQALRQESKGLKGSPADVASTAEQMLHELWHGANAQPQTHRGLMAAAMSVPLPNEPIELRTRLQNDAHFHPTSYSGKINSLSQLVAFMDRNGIEFTNLAGIPSQVRKPTAEQKYYANSTKGIDYRDHDYPLAMLYTQLSPAVQKRFDLSITGIDVTNGPNIAQGLDDRLRNFPGVFNSVGEVTLKKEIISDKNPHPPHIHSADTQQLLAACAQRGLPIILHCDRGVPGDKNKYAGQVMAAIREWAKKMTQWKANDPLAKAGMPDFPPIKPKIVWAHGAGLSRFTAESSDHTERLDQLLADEQLKEVLFIDLSWDFIGHDILENVYDLFTKESLPNGQKLCPTICEGIQNLLKTYKAFTEEGGRSDKADDLGDLNLSAAHRQAAEGIAVKYLENLKDFEAKVITAFEDESVVDKVADMAMNAGTKGNNWLNLCYKHPDRMLFGTDALAIGIKAHGDAAYAMNTRVLYPFYTLLEQLAKKRPGFDGIVEKICTENYKNVFHDPDVKKRRASYEAMLASEKPSEWSTDARAKPFTADDAVISELKASHTPTPGVTMRPTQLTVDDDVVLDLKRSHGSGATGWPMMSPQMQAMADSARPSPVGPPSPAGNIRLPEVPEPTLSADGRVDERATAVDTIRSALPTAAALMSEGSNTQSQLSALQAMSFGEVTATLERYALDKFMTFARDGGRAPDLRGLGDVLDRIRDARYAAEPDTLGTTRGEPSTPSYARLLAKADGGVTKLDLDIEFDIGEARGENNVCMFDTLFQIAERAGHGTRLQVFSEGAPPDAKRAAFASKLQQLFEQTGLIRTTDSQGRPLAQHEQLDFTQGSLHARLLAGITGLRLVMVSEMDGRYSLSPPVGSGPEAFVLRTPINNGADGHFQPLWARPEPGPIN